MKEHHPFMEKVVQMAVQNVQAGHGGPFAAIVVKNGEIIGTGHNKVEVGDDPTAHAEMEAIREACRTLGTTRLRDCILYASGEPCPMCMGAIYWTQLQRVFFGCAKSEAAEVGFPDPLQSFYKEMSGPQGERSITIQQIPTANRLSPFITWSNRNK